jgi:hypothetical protein
VLALLLLISLFARVVSNTKLMVSNLMRTLSTLDPLSICRLYLLVSTQITEPSRCISNEVCLLLLIWSRCELVLVNLLLM